MRPSLPSSPQIYIHCIFMAVEAHHHHLHLFPSQLPQTGKSSHDMQMGFVSPPAANSFLPVNTSPAPVAADGGLTFNNGSGPSSKRPRPPSFLGGELSSHLLQQMLDVDSLVTQHAEGLRAALEERRRRLTRQVLAALEAGVGKRLKAKDEQIARIGKLNWAMEERVKSLCVENQMWRDLAQGSEATVRVLRTNLEQVLAAQARAEQDAEATADDAASCCSGDEAGKEKTGVATEWLRQACQRCFVKEPSVLLLPCRHLCLCAACGPAVNACPVCNCSKIGTVNVNLS